MIKHNINLTEVNICINLPEVNICINLSDVNICINLTEVNIVYDLIGQPIFAALSLFHSERLKLYGVLPFLGAIGLRMKNEYGKGSKISNTSLSVFKLNASFQGRNSQNACQIANREDP